MVSLLNAKFSGESNLSTIGPRQLHCDFLSFLVDPFQSCRACHAVRTKTLAAAEASIPRGNGDSQVSMGMGELKMGKAAHLLSFSFLIFHLLRETTKRQGKREESGGVRDGIRSSLGLPEMPEKSRERDYDVLAWQLEKTEWYPNSF